MPLEATMIIIDNSEFMRNGDYMPTRFAAQTDAVNMVFQTKIDSNPENTVGIMTMAGKSPEVLVTHTKELGQILGGVHAAGKKIGGSIDVPTSLAVAQLALKHRENKNLRQRIIVFAASPLETDPETMVKLAKKLKKNNVAVDIVAFGDAIGEDCGEGVLRAFVENINSSDNSHLLVVEPGNHLLSDALISSPILSADRSASIPEELGGTGAGPSGSGGPAPTGNDFEFGVDPSLDPELAMALRMSMEEAQAREAAQAAAAGTSAPSAPNTTTSATPSGPPTVVPSQRGPPPLAADDDDDDDAELQAALALSKASTGGSEEEDDDDEEDEDGDVEMEDDEEGDDDDDEEEEDDDEIQRAIQMSLQKPGDKGAGAKK